MKRGPFEVTETKIVYKNPWIEVREDKIVRPNGRKGIFGTVDYGSGTSIVALTKENEVYLTREYRYAIDKYTLELPSGGIDDGETPLQAAQRELREETGLTAKKWVYLGVIDPLTVAVKSPSSLFLAENLEQGKATDEETDLIAIEKVSFEKALTMVSKGEIAHAASVIAIQKVAHLKRSK